MKTTIRTLMPFKIQNRLVPRATFDSNSTTSAQSNQTVQITARKVQTTPGKSSVQHVPLQSRTLINVDNPRHVRVTIRRSDSARSTSNLSDSSEYLSENCSGPTYGTPQYNKTSSEYFYVPRNQGNSMSPKIPPNEPVASEYYYQMESQITTGIKKLQELDKKLLAYEYKQPEISSRNTKIKQRQKQQMKSIEIRNQQKQKNDLNTRKKQDYLQEILNKSKKVKELENIIVEKDKKILELEGQLRISSWKISQMEGTNRKGYQDPQRDNSNKLLEELEHQKRLLQRIVSQSAQQKATLQTKVEQKAKQINTRTSQQIARLKQTFEQKQSNFLKQIFALRQTNENNVINLDKEHEQNLKNQREFYEGKIKNLNEQNSKIIMKLKEDYQYERSYFNNQYKLGMSKQKEEREALCLGLKNKINDLQDQVKQVKKIAEEKENEIKVKSKQIQSKDAKLDQSTKILDYYKNQCKKIQTKWKEELFKKSEKEKEIFKVHQQVELLKKQLGQTDKKVAQAKQQSENKILLLDLDLKKSKTLEQAYFKESVILREQNQRSKQSLGQNRITISNLEAKAERLKSVEEEYTKLKQNIEQMRIKQQKIKELEYVMECTKNNLVIQQQKYERQILNIREQFDNKSRDILKNINDHCQQKQGLIKQITSYQEEVKLKQKEINQKDNQLLVVSNTLKNFQKQNQKLKQEVNEQKSHIQQITCLVSSGFCSIKQYFNNPKELCLQKYSEMVNIQKQGKSIGGIKQIMNKLCDVNKQLVEEYLLCSEQLKKEKTKKNIPERDTKKVEEGEKVQKNAQTCYQIEKGQKETQTQSYIMRKRYSIRQQDNDQIDELKMEINMLNEQAQQKEHILEVMQTCIEDYKRMVNDMKSRVQAQEIIEHQYNEILQFFQIESDKSDEAAHEELIQIITAFTNKLQKLIHTVSELETELSNASEQNNSLKEKKKKMMRELKRCEQMIQKACSQNQQLEYRIQAILQKYERSELYTKELTKMINQDNEQIVKSHLTILNFKLRKSFDCQSEQEQTQTQIKNMKRNKLFDSPCFLGSETRINTLDNDEQESPNHKQSQPNSNIIQTFEEFEPEDTLTEDTP